jgi:iron-sulfur cluster repair protein YtfE (RIC family)
MSTPRLDLYAGIHKALRLFMSRTLCLLGSTDALDDAALRAALEQLQRLLTTCIQHLRHEEDFVHPALQKAAGGALASICADHQHHRDTIPQLIEEAAQLPGLPAAARPAALTALYRAVALFVADNFQHMETEEREHNAMLWAHYSDAELGEIHDRLVAHIEPAVMMDLLAWFLPALSPPERAGMLGGMRQGMPPPAFAAVLEIAERSLDRAAHTQLLRALQPEVALAA